MSGPANRRNHGREALRRAVNLLYRFLRAPPQRASGDVCFLLKIDLHGGRLRKRSCRTTDEPRDYSLVSIVPGVQALGLQGGVTP
jgi:hypothetical protein